MASPQHEDAQLALEKLRSAVQSDRVGNEAAALQLYVEATGGLFRVIKAETNAERKAKWTAQLTQYLERAEALKRGLAAATVGGASAASGAAGPVLAPVPAPVPAATVPASAPVETLTEAQRLALTRAIEAVFDRFAVGDSLGLSELNALNAVSGDDPLDSATLQQLTQRYDCTGDGRLLAPGLVELYLDMAGNPDGLKDLRRILTCHGFDEGSLRELESRPSLSASIALPDSASDLAVQLGLRGPVEAVQPAQELEIMEHMEAMAAARCAAEEAEAAERARIKDEAEAAETARVAATEAEAAQRARVAAAEAEAAERARVEAAEAEAAEEARVAAAAEAAERARVAAAEAEAAERARVEAAEAEAAERARVAAEEQAKVAAAKETGPHTDGSQGDGEERPTGAAVVPRTISPPAASITIFVKNIGGGGEVLSVPALISDTIGQVKAIVCDRTGVPVELQQVIFAGGVLQDTASLSECNVTDGTTIHLIHRPAASRPTPAQSVPVPSGSQPKAAPIPGAAAPTPGVEPEPEPEQVRPPGYSPPTTYPQTVVASAPPVSAVVPPRSPPNRYFDKAPLVPAEVMRPPPAEMSLPMIHKQSAERLQKQLGTLIAAAPKADPDFGKRLHQGAELLSTIVATVDAEWRCIVQLCNASMASSMLKSQTHKSHVAKCVGWIQTTYIDGAPDELKEQRRSINRKAEQIAAAGGRIADAVTTSAVPEAEPPSPGTNKLELGVRFFCCEGGGEMRLWVSPTTAIGRVLDDLEAITGPSPDTSKPDCLVVLGRRLERSAGSVADCQLQNGQTLYLVGANRIPPRPLPRTWTVSNAGASSRQQPASPQPFVERQATLASDPAGTPVVMDNNGDNTPRWAHGLDGQQSGPRTQQTPPQPMLPLGPPAAASPSAPPPFAVVEPVGAREQPAVLPAEPFLPPPAAPAPAAAPVPVATIGPKTAVEPPGLPDVSRRAPSSATDPWYDLPTLEAWADNPGLRMSYDVAQSENEIVRKAIDASAAANGGVADSALLTLQSELQVAMIDLEARLEAGTLSLSDYAEGLQAKIMADKRSAVAHKKSGDVEMAKRLLRHTKLMQHELEDIRKEMPAPAPAPASAGSPAGGKKEFKSETARAVQKMMNQFHASVNALDRTTAAQQAELEAELSTMWAQQHGGQRPPKA